MELVVSATVIVEGSKNEYVETIGYLAFFVGTSILARYRLGPCSANGDLLNFAARHCCGLVDVSDDSVLWTVEQERFI